MYDVDQLAPIALFVYNRVEHTRVLIKSLLDNEESRNSDLFVYSDAAKNLSQSEQVSQVRKLIKSIKGFKSITIIEQEENLGLAKSIISGVTELCDKYNQVIVLEDDLVLSKHFLHYMNTALYCYKNEERVMQISGHMFPVNLQSNTDAIFLPFVSTWGWATWKRAWDKFDPMMKAYNNLAQDKVLRNKFNLGGAYPYFKMLEKQRQGKINSWGIRWNLSVFDNSGLVLYPKVSQVDNAGFDGSGTHCSRIVGKHQNSETMNFEVNSFPEVVNLDVDNFIEIKKYLRNENKLTTKFIDRIVTMFRF